MNIDVNISQLPEILEPLVDAHGLNEVLAALATICGDKAEHLRANWQDAASARVWDRAYRAVVKARIAALSL